jgi:E-phenylitaconyl-CoA hydratase
VLPGFVSRNKFKEVIMPGVLYEKKERVAYITINRPEAMNTMNREVWDGLAAAWVSVRDDPEVWVAVVTGAGERAFSVGGDLKEIGEAFAAAEREGRPVVLPIPQVNPMRGLAVWKPLIAAINGMALGGGMELAMACDIRIAAENAVFGLPESKAGLISGMGGTQRLARLVPFGIALQMMMTGESINAAEAHRIGLVNKVVPPAELMPTAEALANKICESAPLSVSAIKESASRGREMTLEEGLRLEQLITRDLLQTADSKEGTRAFVEKRKAQFQGK